MESEAGRLCEATPTAGLRAANECEDALPAAARLIWRSRAVAGKSTGERLLWGLGRRHAGMQGRRRRAERRNARGNQEVAGGIKGRRVRGVIPTLYYAGSNEVRGYCPLIPRGGCHSAVVQRLVLYFVPELSPKGACPCPRAPGDDAHYYQGGLRRTSAASCAVFARTGGGEESSSV